MPDDSQCGRVEERRQEQSHHEFGSTAGGGRPGTAVDATPVVNRNIDAGIQIGRARTSSGPITARRMAAK